MPSFIKAIFLCGLALSCVIGFADDEKPRTRWNCSDPSSGDPFGADFVRYCRLDPEIQRDVRFLFRKAEAAFIDSCEKACLDELDQLQNIIQRYEDSDELRKFCEEAGDLRRRSERLHRLDPEFSVQIAPCTPGKTEAAERRRNER